ncbi:MAG: hypothetical protein HFACDABA_01896 [Anaerolineales bacterium]|nr:hypothetical protein [Anaerolineales bacterium]
MSDKPPPIIPSRHAIDSLAALAAGTLALTGQALLIIPQWLGAPGLGLPANIVAPIGIVLFATGFCLAVSITTSRRNWKTRGVFTAGSFLFGFLGLLYFQIKLVFFIPLLFILAASLLLAAFSTPLSESGDRFTPRLGIAVNLATGILLLLTTLPASRVTETGRAAQIEFLLTGLLLATALAGILAHRMGRPRAQRIIIKTLSLPWLAWGIVSAAEINFAGLIPAASFAAALFFYDLVPWPRIKAPETDILARRLTIILGFILTVFLAGFAWDPPFSDATRGQIFSILFFSEALVVYGMTSLLLAFHQLVRQTEVESSPSSPEDKAKSIRQWEERITRLILPFTATQTEREQRIHLMAQQLASVSHSLELEKRRNAQRIMLSELSRQLEAQLDRPVSAQLAVNTLQRAVHNAFAALYLNDTERRELVLLAIAGTDAQQTPSEQRRPIGSGIPGRAARQRKTQAVTDSRADPDAAEGEERSIVAVPLIDRGHVKGVLTMTDTRPNAFTGHDVQVAEAVAGELLRAWERSDYHHRMMELIQAGISLTSQSDPQAAVQEVAGIARQTLRARFTFVTLLDQDGNFTRVAHAGQAPRLLRSIRRQAQRESPLKTALNSERPFRIRDIRKYKRAAGIEIDFPGLRSMVAIPIRMHGLSVGAILAFGKQGEVFFSENDESLAQLLASQASAAIESAWLSHELRTSFATITQLYQLSIHIVKADELKDAAAAIADAALKLTAAETAGIVLFAPSHETETEVQLSANGDWIPPQHPTEMIRRVMETQQSIILSTGLGSENICFPLKTRVRTYGALWLTMPEQRSARYVTNLQTLANQAGIALERLILLVESRQHASEIESAYRELEETYDHTLAALMSSLDARDRETEGHSVRVSQIARLLGEVVEATPLQRKALERGSLLHDIGKIGISDTILHKPGPLNESEWAVMRQHPDIGTRIVEGIPFLQDTLPIIRYHQERWDGSGYPLGLSGKEIPLLARVFAVADAFDALTSDRPYRKRVQIEDALHYLKENAGRLFDPQIVAALLQLHEQGALVEMEQA